MKNNVRYIWRNKKIRRLSNTLFFFLSALYLMIIFLSYNMHDRCFFVFNSSHAVANWAGIVGSNTASCLLFFFGSATVLLIPLLLFMSFAMWHKINSVETWIRTIAIATSIIACSALGALYRIKFINSPYQPGGMVGNSIISFFSRWIDSWLLLIIILLFLFISFLVATELSFMSLVIWVNNYGYQLFMRRHYIKKIMRFFFNSVSFPIKKIRSWYKLLSEQESIPAFEFEHLVQESLQVIAMSDAVTTKSHEQSDTNQIANDTITDHNNLTMQTSNFDVKIHNHTDFSYQLPPADLCKPHEIKTESRQQQMQELAAVLEQKLERFGIAGSVISIKVGPVVTLFEYQPAIDSKISRIIALEDDLALALQALSIRIIAPIPGKSVVGFEVANRIRIPVHFSTLIHTQKKADHHAVLPLLLGVDTSGVAKTADLATMPHLLLAGATGSGKSVALNTMIASLLYYCLPKDLKLILVDPKRLEFSAYADIPHLLFPIVTNPKEVVSILKWLINTMQERYELLARVGVRNITDYLKLPESRQEEKMPYIVVIIDELADLMLVSGKEIEESIARISQMARAAGIHMIVATQRPSVDVITGTIKVNFPSRLSCRVISKIDSRTILDATGADKLLGKGDMLYLDASGPIQRIHGAYIADNEIEQLGTFWRNQGKPTYVDLREIMSLESNKEIDAEDESLYAEVLEFLTLTDEISISLLQRRFRIGYNRSARIIELLEAQGKILSIDGNKTRKVLK